MATNQQNFFITKYSKICKKCIIDERINKHGFCVYVVLHVGDLVLHIVLSIILLFVGTDELCSSETYMYMTKLVTFLMHSVP